MDDPSYKGEDADKGSKQEQGRETSLENKNGTAVNENSGSKKEINEKIDHQAHSNANPKDSSSETHETKLEKAQSSESKARKDSTSEPKKQSEQNNLHEAEEHKTAGDGSKIASLAATVAQSKEKAPVDPAAQAHKIFKLFEEAVLQRKKSSHDKFMAWQEQRAIKINSYRLICESIIQRLNTRASLSVDGIEGVLKFFTDRKNQEELYYTATTKNLSQMGNLFADRTLKETGTWSLPKILKECDDFHVRQIKNSQLIAGFIQKTILKDMLGDLQKDFSKRLQIHRNSISDTRKRVSTLNERTAKKAQKYTILFNQIVKEVNLHKKTVTKDLYNKELAITASAQIQSDAHTVLGKQTLEYWDFLLKLEVKRYESLKQALSAYLDKLAELYGSAYGDPEQLRKMLQAFEVDSEISTLFNVNNILTEEEMKYIKRALDKPESADPVTFADIKEFLKELKHEVPPSKPLVLKEWDAFKEGGMVKNFKPCGAVVTVDGNILLVDKVDERISKKADSVIKLSSMALREDPAKKNPLVVEILETKPGFLIDTKSKYAIKFNSADQVDEFNHYVRNYRG